MIFPLSIHDFTPDPTGGAYSAPQTPSWFQGAASWQERNGGEGREGLGEGKRGRKGKGGNGEGRGKGGRWGIAPWLLGIDAPEHMLFKEFYTCSQRMTWMMLKERNEHTYCTFS